MSKHDQITTLRYLQWQELYEHEKPFQVFSAIPQDAKERRDTNLVLGDGPPVTIHDVRGSEAAFTLDQHGFAFARQVMPAADLSNEDGIRNEYVPQLLDLIRSQVDGADLVHCFDWGVRVNKTLELDKINVNDKMQILEPARQVHCDQSPAGALGRLHQQLPGEVERAAKGRLRIINIWRPIRHVVEDRPLALCDGSTVDESDLVEADHITRQYLGSTMYGMYSPSQRWYYLHRQEPDELTLIKIFDSDANVRAKQSLHTSFQATNIAADSLPRESIEARFLVITYK